MRNNSRFGSTGVGRFALLWACMKRMFRKCRMLPVGHAARTISREQVANTFLSGEGIEIGALHNPLTLPEGARARYVDRMPKDELYRQYPELRDQPLVEVEILDDGQYLRAIGTESQDFVVANHFLEHAEDPIVTVANLLRVTKPGGVVYLAVPNMSKTFDRNRDPTTLAHVIDDHELGVETSRRSHYEEWVSLVEPHFGRAYDEVGFRNRVDELLQQKYSIHFHCWNEPGLKELLRYLKNDRMLPFSIALFAQREDEYICILKKQIVA